jgi:uncharacterized protein
MLDELDVYADTGQTPREWQFTTTVVPPRFFNLADQDGTITPGCRADLVLLDANPLDRPGTLRGPKGSDSMTVGEWSWWTESRWLCSVDCRCSRRSACPSGWSAPICPPGAAIPAPSCAIPPGGYRVSMTELHRHATHAAMANRLKRAEGYLRRVLNMIEEGSPYLDLTNQSHTIELADDDAKRAPIDDHIDHCLKNGPKQDMAEIKASTRLL